VHELRDRLRAEHSELARLRAELTALRAGETSKDMEIEKFKLTAYAARDELEAGLADIAHHIIGCH
jgi:predicted  nucleic acid-binding Zn-ribbon protein